MTGIRQLTAVLLCMATLVAVGVRPALAAEASVEYRGGAEGFVSLPSGNLFGSMKGIMPGSSITQAIVIGNRSTVPVDLYLSSQGDSSELLSQLTLRIALVSGDGSEVELYSGSAAGATNGSVHLGRYGVGRGATLNATLTAPITLGNRWQSASGTVVWVFGAVESRPTGGDDDDDDDDDTTVVTRPADIDKASAVGLLPATGSHSKL